MANKFLRNLWTIDTAGAQVINDDPKTRIKGFRWVVTSAPTAGDAVKVTDAADNVLWESVAPSTSRLTDQTFFEPNYTLESDGGIKVSTLDTGTLYIYLA